MYMLPAAGATAGGGFPAWQEQRCRGMLLSQLFPPPSVQKSEILSVRSFLRHWRAIFFATNPAQAVFTGLESGNKRPISGERRERTERFPRPVRT